MTMPPPGSSIQIETGIDGETITMPKGSGGLMRYAFGLFLLFWLGGWASGFMSAFDQVSNGEGGMFLLFWLASWTLGGAFAMYFLYSIFRPPVPEKFVLKPSGITYDSGVSAFNANFSFKPNLNSWKDFMAKRTRKEIALSEIGTLALRETEGGNRLTIDLGPKRVDLGSAATEIEREWLYEAISARYS